MLDRAGCRDRIVDKGRTWFVGLLVVAALCRPAVSSGADETLELLYLKSGDRYSGHSVSIVDGQLIWQPRFGDQMRVPLDEVVRLETVISIMKDPESPPEPDPAPEAAPEESATVPEDPVVESLIESPAEETVDEEQSWIPPVVDAVVVPLQQSYEYTQTAAVEWTKRAEFGGQLNQGNSDQRVANVGIDLERTTEQFYGDFDVGGQYGASAGQTVINRWNANGTIDFAKTRKNRWILFTTTKNQYDEFRNLDYRGTLSGGVGYRFSNEADRRFIARLGPAVTWEIFNTPHSRRTTPDLFAELESAWRLGDRTRVETKTTIHPAMTEDDAMRLNSNQSLFVSLDEDSRWQLKVSFVYSYVAQPNSEQGPNDYTTAVSLVYTRK